MLNEGRVATRLPAQDLERARAFYAEKLGLHPVEEREGGLRYVSAGGEFALFESAGAASGNHTQMGWEVDDIEATVTELRSRGVIFEEYDFPGLRTVDGIADIEGNYPSKGIGERGAWFRDSEGNLLGIGEPLRDRLRMRQSQGIIPEAPLEQTPQGLVPKGEGWFVVNAGEAQWLERPGRGMRCQFEGEPAFEQLGISLFVLQPGEPIGMYHWEADQEDFLVLGGEALLIVEGQERSLRRWDFVHCPPDTEHMIVAAGAGPCVLLAVGAREHASGDDWGGYRVDETARRRGVSVERETSDVGEAYARFPEPRPAPYRDGSLPGG